MALLHSSVRSHPLSRAASLSVSMWGAVSAAAAAGRRQLGGGPPDTWKLVLDYEAASPAGGGADSPARAN